MICHNCHNQIDDDALFCNFCGSERMCHVVENAVWNVGRDVGNDIVLPFDMVSGCHCKIHLDGGQLSIQDMNSANGTYVNDVRIPVFQITPIHVNDKICLGSHMLPAGFLSSLARGATLLEEASKKPHSVRLSIGRGRDNDISLDFPQISERHAWLIKSDDGWAIEDRGSTNKTYVNDRSAPISEIREIKPEDTVYFGSFKISAIRLIEMQSKTTLGRFNPVPMTVTEAETLFGRDPNATVFLDYPQISWRHAKLVHTKKGFFIEDLGSTNGTFVNGQRVTSCPVKPGDTISLGSYSFRLTDKNKMTIWDHRGDIRLDSEEITVRIKDKTILDNVSLSIFPSEFVGLMGPSGAGKTTLLLALNGYLRPQSGRSVINGQSLYGNYDRFRGMIGYVPQDDIIHPELTVFEALYYTAKLRLPTDTTNDQISALIDKTLAKLGMDASIKNVIIGSPEKKGISGGQRKRVNLAMELLTDPSLLFLDEPTSGLSAVDTLMVIEVLRNLANKGKTIILTIHQPSLEAYKKMDNVIILSQGELVYYGPAHPDSITFFNPDKPGLIADNPDNVLKPLTPPNNGRDGDALEQQKRITRQWRERYEESDYYSRYVTKRVGNNLETDEPGSFSRKSHSSAMRQWWTLTSRYCRVKMKDIVDTVILLAQAPIIAGLIAMAFAELKDGKDEDIMKVPIPLFFLVISAIWFGTSNSAREIVSEKAIYLRERMVNLKILPYVFSKYAVLGILCGIQCLLLVLIVHPIIGLKGSFPHVLGITFMAALAGLSIGLFISSVNRTQQAAVAIVPLILIPMVILGGGTLYIKDMNPLTRFCSNLMPSRWTYEQIIHVEQKGLDEDRDDSNSDSEIIVETGSGSKVNLKFQEKENPCELNRNLVECLYISNENEYTNSHEAILGVMGGFIVGFLVLTMIALRLKDRV